MHLKLVDDAISNRVSGISSLVLLFFHWKGVLNGGIGGGGGG